MYASGLVLRAQIDELIIWNGSAGVFVLSHSLQSLIVLNCFVQCWFSWGSVGRPRFPSMPVMHTWTHIRWIDEFRISAPLPLTSHLSQVTLSLPASIFLSLSISSSGSGILSYMFLPQFPFLHMNFQPSFNQMQ